MIFFTISFFIVIVFFRLINNFFSNLDGFPSILGKIIIIIYSFLAFIFFVDFITLGYLKRNKKTAKLYFPIYLFFSYLTLSFAYRPLVYNFLDQKKSKWLATFIVPTYFLTSVLTSGFGKFTSNFEFMNQRTTSTYINKRNYEDLLTEDKDIIDFVSIPSKIIEKKYLKVFVGFNDFMEDAIFKYDSTQTPLEDKRSYNFYFDRIKNKGINTNKVDKTSIEKQEKFLNTLNELYKLKIDTTFYDKEFLITKNKNERLGFETYINIEELKKGKHLLRLIGPKLDIEKDTLITIPFWFYPE